MKKALDSYLKAAERGFHQALVKVAKMFNEGVGVPKDPVQAMELYLRAAQHGVVEGQLEVARLLSSGKRDRASLLEAYKWYSILSTGNDELASTGRSERDKLRMRMAARDVLDAQRRAQEWWSNHKDPKKAASKGSTAGDGGSKRRKTAESTAEAKES